MIDRRLLSKGVAFVGGYAVALIAVALAIPLRVPEILAIAWRPDFSWGRFWGWSSQALDPSPLGYLVQLPFVFLLGVTRLVPRLPGLLFALASCILFLRLADVVVRRRRYWALLLFMLLPLQLAGLTAATQYEMATCFVLMALIAFFDLRTQPDYKRAARFALAVAACLFTDRHAGLPAFGTVLFLLRFSGRPQERRAVWFGLGACIVGVGAYAPFYFWAHERANPFWLTEPGISASSFAEMTLMDWLVAAGLLLIVCGIFAGLFVSFRLPVTQVTRRLSLFCLVGSVFIPVTFAIAYSTYVYLPIAPHDLLYVAPAAVILFVSVLDWLALQERSLQAPTAAAGIILLALCALADVRFVGSTNSNLALESRYVGPQLHGDSCVVFVSERYSKALFLVFHPELAKEECSTSFHHRIVLASQPYVRPDQQANAESYFRGLSFAEVRRIWSGGGEIVVMESK